MFNEDNQAFNNPSSFSTPAQGRRKIIPLVPKFDSFDSSPSSSLPEKKSFNMGFPERSDNEVGTSSSFPSQKDNSNKIEEEVSPVNQADARNINAVGAKDGKGNSSKPVNPLKMPAFVANIDLQFINKLYADKELASKDANKEKKEEKKEVKKPATTPQESAASHKIQKLREEYDPARPTDYEAVLAERRRRQHEEEDRKQREQDKMQEEEYISLGEDKPNFSKYPTMEEEVPPEEEDEPSAEEKVMRMLEKQGWKMGEGLGKNKQGMTTPLIAKKVTGNTAVIENSALDMTATLPPELVAKKAREAYYNMPPTKILVLLNMVSPQETIDEQLKDEVFGEAQNYGRVMNIEICEIKNVPEEETIRIFVEYDRKESAVKGFENLYGRFFAGRTIIAKFYNEKSFEERNLYLPL